MFSLFGAKKSPSKPAAGDTAKGPKRMTFEERKIFRQEMIYQSVRESFLSMEVVSSMYKFKVVPADERHHRFVIMIDVAKSFVTGKDTKTKSFAALEAAMRANAYKRFAILIVGTYWRVSETEDQFERFTRNSDATGKLPAARAKIPHDQTATELPMSRLAHQPVSDEESAAFMAALESGLALPAVHVGDREYQSDLAPLDGGIMIGGTQYGKL